MAGCHQDKHLSSLIRRDYCRIVVMVGCDCGGNCVGLVSFVGRFHEASSKDECGACDCASLVHLL